MADKCALCNNPVDTLFLEKINGTFVKDSKGKKRAICASCQKTSPEKELKAKL